MAETKGGGTERIKIAILGAGNMGTALAHALATQGHFISVWDIHREVLAEIESDRRNSRFLPGISLDRGILTCGTPEECVRQAQLVIVCIPSIYVGDLLAPLLPILADDAIILNVSKGFAPATPEPLPVALQRQMPDHAVVHLAGPAIANEFVSGRRAFLVMASGSEQAARQVSMWFAGPNFSSSTTTDLIGASLGGILKNTYAILLGAVSEMDHGLSPNHESAIVTTCIQEMAGLSVALGGTKEAVYGLAGLGDFLATGYSTHSHNRALGRSLAKGKSLKTIETEVGNLPEGARATPIVLSLAERHGISLPLAEWVDDLLKGNSSTLAHLMRKIG